MLGTVTWDQTLASLALAALAAFVAYRAAARALWRQAWRREQIQRRDALEQVLSQLQGPAGDYLGDPTLDYPQRDMVELERRALQAQILFWRDLSLQRALHDASSPAAHAAAATQLRAVVASLDAELGERGGRT